MLYDFKWAQHWLLDLPDNSCNTLPWRTQDVRISIKYILINHSASVKNNERHPALPLLGYRIPPSTRQSIRAALGLTEHIHSHGWSKRRCSWLQDQGGPCKQVEEAAGGPGWVMSVPRAPAWRWVLVGPCPISISACRAGDAANPLMWVQEGAGTQVLQC